MFPLQPQLIPVPSLHHTPHSSRAALCHQTTQTPLWGCQSPCVTQETPGFVFCSKDTQAPDTSHLCCDFEDLGRSEHHLSHALPPFPTPAKHLSQHQLQNLPPEDSRRGWLCCREPPHTCEDGLVDAQGGGADFNDPDVCWHLVTNCKERSRAALSGGTGSTQQQTPN